MNVLFNPEFCDHWWLVFGEQQPKGRAEDSRRARLMVALWFAKIERDVLAPGVFTSVSDLNPKLMRYIRHYNQSPRTVKSKYSDPRRVSTQSDGTGH
jgi:hypothetical protein